MSAFTTTRDKIFVEKIAMEIFRKCGFKHGCLDQEGRIEGPIALEIVKLGLPVLTRIVMADPERPVMLGPDRHSNNRVWIQRLAIQIVAEEIRRIVGFAPRFGQRHSDEDLIFLGGDRRRYVDLARTGLSRLVPEPSYVYVDMWGHPDGKVKVVHGTGPNDHVSGHRTVQTPVENDIQEAYRYLRLIATPVAIREAFRRLALLSTLPAS